MRRKLGKKGNLFLFFIFVASLIIVVTVTALVAPMGALVGSEMYLAGAQMIENSNATIQAIENDTIREGIDSVFAKSLQAQATNIEINSQLYRYSWLMVIFVSVVVLFMISRSLVARQAGGLT